MTKEFDFNGFVDKKLGTLADLGKKHETLYNAFIKATHKFLFFYGHIMCSVSGGSDSDIMIDWLESMELSKRGLVTYVFFNTGLEYDATKRHLNDLEKKYNIKIEHRNAIKPIPLCTKTFGQPLLSKRISDMIERLQVAGFQWEDASFGELIRKYPNCKVPLRWWCNCWGVTKKGKGKTGFDIRANKLLKEFIIANHLKFKVSAQCCKWAKKEVAKQALQERTYTMSCQGIRRAEGGARATAYKNCFTAANESQIGIDEFRMLFFITDADKAYYKQRNGICYSDCYEIWGMKRTGCAGCPFGKFDYELGVCEKHEPKFVKAANAIFGDAYAYTRKWRKFKSENKNHVCNHIFDPINRNWFDKKDFDPNKKYAEDIVHICRYCGKQREDEQ